MLRTFKVTGNHVMYDRGAWFLRVIMSSSRALCCLPSVKKQKHDLNFFFVQCIIKQLLDSVFVISRIIKVSVRVISLSLRLRLITLTSTLIILDITKTSSNNCFYYMATIVRALWLAAKRALFSCNDRALWNFFSAQRLFWVGCKTTCARAKTTEKMDKVELYFQ